MLIVGIDKTILKSLINIAQTQTRKEGYSDKCWGLTASYSRKHGSTGYSAHQPIMI
jgi:hypothetical protein